MAIGFLLWLKYLLGFSLSAGIARDSSSHNKQFRPFRIFSESKLSIERATQPSAMQLSFQNCMSIGTWFRMGRILLVCIL